MSLHLHLHFCQAEPQHCDVQRHAGGATTAMAPSIQLRAGPDAAAGCSRVSWLKELMFFVHVIFSCVFGFLESHPNIPKSKVLLKIRLI